MLTNEKYIDGQESCGTKYAKSEEEVAIFPGEWFGYRICLRE